MTPVPEERLLLVLVGDDRAGAELPRQGVLTVGSSRDRAGFLVEGDQVADVHCAIARAKGGGWALKDLGSAAGTLVNGKRVEVARLSAGDRIHVGSRELRVLAPVGADASSRRTSDTKALAPTRRGEVVGETGDEIEIEPTSVRAAAASPNLSGYRIERLLGRGGMGNVHLAMQTSLDRPVALKVLAPHLAADRDFVRRFQAEARAAAALAHPNVVTVYDVGEEHGVHYLSMEYMDRGTLEERVAGDGRLSWRETLDVLRDAAAGLVYAEAKGIVHRDLKPANLMQNHVGATKIADLGLATHVEAEERQTAEKKVFGTPHFMSPEQVRGEKVDGRSDLYSLGATAYRLLTGHTPFEGTSAREIVRAHLALEPRPMRDFAPDLPEEALALVARLMRKDPGERFASAAELLREIERLRSQGSPSPAPASGPRKGTPKLAVALASLLLLALLGAGAWWLNANRPWNDGEGVTGAPSGPSRRVDSTSVPATGNPPSIASLPSHPAQPPAQTSDGVGGVSVGPTAKPKDDDKTLQLLEANARVALLELLGKEMTPAEKRDALRALAVSWRGTSAATEALEKADQIDTDLATRVAADVERQARRDELVARLEVAAGPGENPPRPGPALLNLRAVPGQEALAGDPEFTARKKQIERSLVARAAAYARERLDETAADMAKGDFESVHNKLTELMPVFELPDFPPGEGPPGVDEIFELGRNARERLKNLELLHGQFVTHQTREDALAIAQGLGGPTGLEHEIRALDLSAARERLAGLEQKLASKEAKALVHGLLGDVEGADLALRTLGREFASWRRKGFTEPRAGKSATRNAVGADAEGILAEGEGGSVEHVPWSAFGGDDREISRLFTERLAREWTPEETRGIAGLLRLTAAVEAAGRAGKMFDPSRHSNFTEADTREMADCFVQAQVWAQKAGSEEALAKEIAAARELTIVCQKMTEGAWSVAVAATEGLLARWPDTLLVRLLSDGTPPEAH